MLRFSPLHPRTEGMFKSCLEITTGVKNGLYSGNANSSVAQIVGIVVGSVCGLLLLGILILILRSKRGQYLLHRKQSEERRSNSGLIVEPFNDLQTPLATSPLYDTASFTPQNLKGQLSRGTIEYSQSNQPLAVSVKFLCRFSFQNCH
jgi:hypothetical protein